MKNKVIFFFQCDGTVNSIWNSVWRYWMNPRFNVPHIRGLITPNKVWTHSIYENRFFPFDIARLVRSTPSLSEDVDDVAKSCRGSSVSPSLAPLRVLEFQWPPTGNWKGRLYANLTRLIDTPLYSCLSSSRCFFFSFCFALPNRAVRVILHNNTTRCRELIND